MLKWFRDIYIFNYLNWKMFCLQQMSNKALFNDNICQTRRTFLKIILFKKKKKKLLLHLLKICFVCFSGVLWLSDKHKIIKSLKKLFSNVIGWKMNCQIILFIDLMILSLIIIDELVPALVYSLQQVKTNIKGRFQSDASYPSCISTSSQLI